MPKRNAFWFFMRELMDEMRNDGVEVSSFAEMPAYAGPKWEKMDAFERRRFEEMVCTESASDAGDAGSGRMNNQRELISDHAKKVKAEKDMKKLREQQVQALRHSWPAGNDLIKEKFQLIFFEYFIKTVENEYLPCEVAVLEFSLEEGITRKFSTFIDPGPCPKGFMFEERLRSEQRHQIPCCDRFNIPDFKEEERFAFKDLEKILEQIIDFTSNGGTNRNSRAFTFGDDVEMVIGCLSYLYSKTKRNVKFGPESLPRILPLEHLLPQFYLHSDQVTGNPPSINSIQRVLTQSVWDYESGIRCTYHDVVETRFCALSQVHRWAFAIFNAMKMPIREEDDFHNRGQLETFDKSVFDFALTTNHLPAPTKSSFAVLKPSHLPGRNRDNAYWSTAGSVSGTSAASSSIRDGASGVSRNPQRPHLSASPPPPPPGTQKFFGRGFGIKSRVSEVGMKRSPIESSVRSSSNSSLPSGEQQQQQLQQQQEPSQALTFGRGKGCVLRKQ